MILGVGKGSKVLYPNCMNRGILNLKNQEIKWPTKEGRKGYFQSKYELGYNHISQGPYPVPDTDRGPRAQAPTTYYASGAYRRVDFALEVLDGLIHIPQGTYHRVGP
ncbi:hypothetical protein PPACK8108_LOCUS13026 [Phakopsora pachyrhizi]|uniref:Uncharacterized protein n=1 Tax=Phakopsora pachyrhizi TaxID=170000 RepID=A0AAV0B406_PHAPC|nr:hypothetical protein PPACK8108_LOCUS13026 [Phakopsora pachyrhizi]